jgi:hypothetical protein
MEAAHSLVKAMAATQGRRRGLRINRSSGSSEAVEHNALRDKTATGCSPGAAASDTRRGT